MLVPKLNPSDCEVTKDAIAITTAIITSQTLTVRILSIQSILNTNKQMDDLTEYHKVTQFTCNSLPKRPK